METTVNAKSGQILGASTAAFTVCFAVWTIFSIIGIRIRQDLGLSETQFGLLVGTPILTGSLLRVALGIWTDRYGGRIVFTVNMLAAAAATFLLTYAHTYPQMLVAALGVGIAGGSFSVGVAYVSRWFPPERQGTALGIFGAGNVGAAVTKFLAPFVLVAFGWQAVAQVWAAALVVMAVIFWLATDDDPVIAERRRSGIKPKSAWLELEPLKNVQIWRFALYYFFVFGAFVALALWLPQYLINVYGLDIKTAGMIAAFFSVPASLFRAYGGHLSDSFGARRVLYWTFLVSVAATFVLSYPPTDYLVHGVNGTTTSFHIEMGLFGFIVTIFVLGFFMALGKAAVYKHIPVYYPDHVGSVGGLVGMIGGLGGFVLPILFGLLLDLTGLWTSCFMALFLLVSGALLWMHMAIRQMERGTVGEALAKLPPFPEMQDMPAPVARVRKDDALTDWRPEDKTFWAETGRRIAKRNLWLSIPALLLSFAIWQVWSVVVAKLPLVGFTFTTDQLFWLAALPGISGATLRIFYSFMVPIFGGRLWTTLTTWSLIIPAVGIGYAVQNPDTPYAVLLILALLCGFGGGNFASSMANISFFFPKAEKGNALALNAGLGNLGVSVVQFVVPLAITTGIFGWLGGDPAMVKGPTGDAPLWLQNAGFVFVPFIALSAFAAWFGMNDIASAKASFSEQAVIFQRRHNWIMCWLYTGTFGSFIGYSAGFPLLTKMLFPDVNALQYAFLGPLVGALSRSGSGWLADKYGGARVTFWAFVLMIAGVAGVLWFIGIKDQPGAFMGFFVSFLLLFFATGVGNASTFQMIPVIMAKEMGRLLPKANAEARRQQAEKESAAITGFTSAIAAFGAFFIPKSYGTSIALTGAPNAALLGFLLFYVSCLAITWGVYSRKGGLLHDIERAKRGAPAHPAAAE
ncbi:MFS transporter [Mesorhizobium sp. M1C.F.Ca.ET.193.01.1.1]|uniref:nitrate/nitrite transporter n=1 Tax=unclassified Mesorhizobium TaxID=325217 RepID=UPI000FD31EEF|nr:MULTISPECIES: MFS transporter [unclassified Mesorhizobium]TGS98149.1 MFS transporter [bacterium M00.F.Ca.ET.177.01.1.1]TGQ52748.1 MFS transporter [Mesorhizobium sp. M1C.F.Ca.ET.210.01.1.1]TGQ69929.1 MFS transporter [Mesorhizobium sp. M1C.F.Ca.ET.212.01.1.1]TGR05616.1 MFS transporter [Mesorhizobium sp. M1C.F.Ca.ET.204.01.1.1]TGR26165.1 MFS transporter [Mesorhizobium sp. M1C.F.Ca.ET.196.01.1.1]